MVIVGMFIGNIVGLLSECFLHSELLIPFSGSYGEVYHADWNGTVSDFISNIPRSILFHLPIH